MDDDALKLTPEDELIIDEDLKFHETNFDDAIIIQKDDAKDIDKQMATFDDLSFINNNKIDNVKCDNVKYDNNHIFPVEIRNEHMKCDILKWLSEYDDSLPSFIQYLIDKFSIAEKIFKLLLEICLDESYTLLIRNNSAAELIIVTEKHYLIIYQYWYNLLLETRKLFIELVIPYKKLYGTLIFLEFYTKIKPESKPIRLYFDFIVYFDCIESTYNYDTVITFTNLCIKYISDKSLLDFMSSYVYDHLIYKLSYTENLVLLRGFLDILNLDKNKRKTLYKILYKKLTSESCQILNLLFRRYGDDPREFTKFYYPLLKSKDKAILREVVKFWLLRISPLYANFLFKTLIQNVNIEIPEIYQLLQKIAEEYNIVFDKKITILIKNDIKLMTHLYMFCSPFLPEVFSKYINGCENISAYKDLILKLLVKDFSNLLPYIIDILRKCVEDDVDTKNIEILVLILNTLDNQGILGVPDESWNMYLKAFREDIKYCKENIKYYNRQTKLSVKLKHIRLLMSLKDPILVPPPLSLYTSLNNEYLRFKFDLEYSAYINKYTDKSLILEIHHSHLFISKNEVKVISNTKSID